MVFLSYHIRDEEIQVGPLILTLSVTNYFCERHGQGKLIRLIKCSPCHCGGPGLASLGWDVVEDIKNALIGWNG